MYHATKCIKHCNLNMFFRHSRVQQARSTGSRNDDILNLLASTLQSNKITEKEEKQVSWGISQGGTRKRKKKQKAKKNVPLHYAPLRSTAFSGFVGLDDSLKLALNMQYDCSLPIQDIVLPDSLKCRSLLIQSATGSGKTLAFVIPIVNALVTGKLGGSKRCIVIAPTKELCSQLYSVLLSLVPRPSSVLLLGDHSKRASQQNKLITSGVPIIVTTPSSLNSKLKQGVMRLLDTSILVVDEFDRLFGEEDFEGQVNHILAGLAKKTRFSQTPSQFLITSATVSDEMKSFIQKHVPDIKVVKTNHVTPPSLKHTWVIAPLHRRTETLLQLLHTHSSADKTQCKKCIIFVQRIEIGEGLLELLDKEGYFVCMINGDMPAGKRKVVFDDFKAGKYDILIATDLIARGIDIPDCEMVIQVQPGEDTDMYLHRAGRCARAGKPGDSYVIACDADIRDREVFRLVKERVSLEILDATTVLPEKESGVVSVLENSLHHVSRKEELSFSIDINMTQPVTFYQKLVMDLGLRPVNAAQVPGKQTFALWYSSPVEAWAAQSALKEHYRLHCLPPPDIGVFRYQAATRSVLDWDSYFSEVRKERREADRLSYKNFVKREMGKKRRRQGRYKYKGYLPGS